MTFKEYTRAIDIWSVGCVLAEMLSGKPLFPGRDCTLSQVYLGCVTVLTTCLDHHQLSIILDVLGTPSLDDFYAITSQRSREYIRALPFRKKKPFSQLFPEANPLVRPWSRWAKPTTCTGADLYAMQALDLMEKCLTFSPKRRIDVNEALQHPYLAVRFGTFRVSARAERR